MKPTQEQIDAALAYASDLETDEQIALLDNCNRRIHRDETAHRFSNAAAILAAAYRELLNKPHEIICTKCGLREERGEKLNADF